MERSVLEKLIIITRQKLLENKVVYHGCKDVRELMARVFDKLEEPYEVKTFYIVPMGNPINIRCWHTWVEISGYVIETNPYQVFDVDLAIDNIPKDVWYEDIKIRESGEDSIWNHPADEWADKFHNGLADEIVKELRCCMNRANYPAPGLKMRAGEEKYLHAASAEKITKK